MIQAAIVYEIYKKLGSCRICIRATGHGKCSTTISNSISGFVENSSPKAFSFRGEFLCIASTLDHEIPNDSVKHCTVVESILHVCEEVNYGNPRIGPEEFNGYIAFTGFNYHTRVWLLILFGFRGFVFGNINALAMEPLGHMAGLGASIIGALSTLIALSLSVLIGAQFDGTIVPLVVGFAVLDLAALGVIAWTEKGSKS